MPDLTLKQIKKLSMEEKVTLSKNSIISSIEKICNSDFTHMQKIRILEKINDAMVVKLLDVSKENKYEQ